MSQKIQEQLLIHSLGSSLLTGDTEALKGRVNLQTGSKLFPSGMLHFSPNIISIGGVLLTLLFEICSWNIDYLSFYCYIFITRYPNFIILHS